MGRRGKEDRSYRLQKEEASLSEKHLTVRIAAFVVCIVLGFTALGFAINGFLSTESGWREVEAYTTEASCAGEFSFQYCMGQGALSATAENKQLTQLYTDVVVKAYQLFNVYEGFSGITNLWYLNRHPNEEVVVDEVLYRAFSQLRDSDNRLLYLGPIYETYRGLFFCQEDFQTVDYDPYQNPEIAAYYQKIADFAKDPANIELKLLGENKVCLAVSGEYQLFAEENEITNFLDFSWMKNAFIVDYLTETMMNNGFTNGYISSFDGFTRNLSREQVFYSFQCYDRENDALRIVGKGYSRKAGAMVCLRSFPVRDQDSEYYYVLSSGEIRVPYLDGADGRSKAGAKELISYSQTSGCAQILMNVIPAYIRDTLDIGAVNDMTAKDIYSLYLLDKDIQSNDDGLSLTEIYIGYRFHPLEDSA